MKDGISGRLREARTRAGLTQAALGQRLGLRARSQTTIAKWETGHFTGSSFPRLRELCQVLKVSADWLLGIESDPQQQEQRAPEDRISVSIQQGMYEPTWSREGWQISVPRRDLERVHLYGYYGEPVLRLQQLITGTGVAYPCSAHFGGLLSCVRLNFNPHWTENGWVSLQGTVPEALHGVQGLLQADAFYHRPAHRWRPSTPVAEANDDS